LRVLELLYLFGVGQLRGIHLDLRRLCARFDNRGQNLPFLLGVALNRCDQIRNKIGAALVIVLNLSPLRFGLLFQRRNRVVATTGESQSGNERKGETADGRH
jgi:hypothetical protein